MNRAPRKEKKVWLSMLSGFLVALFPACVHLGTLPLDQNLLIHALLGDMIAGLTATIVCLAIQLKQEEVHYQVAMDRAVIISELNHHVRNAIFPLSLALHKTGDANSSRIADEAMERLNIALRDATADAISGRVTYAQPTAMARSKSAA
jgi:hypothetical protein